MNDQQNSNETPDASEKRSVRTWFLWLAINLVIAAFFFTGLFSSASTVKSAWLPGKTTHGHYQIEMDCDACHSPAVDGSEHSSSNVMSDACNRCHADQLTLANDTHPAKKFNDPTNAVLLETLNAQDCLACHREHVPEQTLSMGLTMPADYCWHCHQDVADSRPSHEGMAFDSCATAGCHNYHDNRALYEKFLNDHYGEPDFKSAMTLIARNFGRDWRNQHPSVESLHEEQADGPEQKLTDKELVQDWEETAHAIAGVNCSGCHVNNRDSDTGWSDAVAMESCESCHAKQNESFVRGKHGMRLAAGMSAMTPAEARLPMHAGAAHKELTCNACHSGHRFDTKFAATQACLQCHADSHSMAYGESSHAALWQDELAGTGEVGTGVSCATCHLPRLSDGDSVWVNHDQNASLRPNETMARQVCLQCHGLEYSLTALADQRQIASCFALPVEEELPSVDSSERNATPRVQSVRMAHDWFRQKEAQRIRRRQSNQ